MKQTPPLAAFLRVSLIMFAMSAALFALSLFLYGEFSDFFTRLGARGLQGREATEVAAAMRIACFVVVPGHALFLAAMAVWILEARAGVARFISREASPPPNASPPTAPPPAI